jgi:hypothetical protein
MTPRIADAPLLDADLLAVLESRWRDQRWPGLERRRPGLRDDEIDAGTAPLGLRLPLEARRWWGWHDGIAIAPGDLRKQHEFGGPGFVYLTLAAAVELYAEMRRIANEVAGPGEPLSQDELWDPSWFPVTKAYNGGIVACDCSAPSAARTPIRAVHWKNGVVGEIRARSFGEMVSWWIDALDRGAWCYDLETGNWLYDWEQLDRERELTDLV